MDFGDILDNWEKLKPENRVYDKDTGASAASGLTGSNRSAAGGDFEALRKINHKRRIRLLHKRPEAALDLHGLTCEEAWTALQNFFGNSRQKGLEKVLIIHGKGNHWASDSSNAGVLRDLSRRFIETCPFAGESGNPSAKEGGSGATWVILKQSTRYEI